MQYCNGPKFLEWQVWAHSADLDQTAPERPVWSGSTPYAIPFAYFGHITQWWNHIVNGPDHATMCLMAYANNKYHTSDSMICILARSKVSSL